MFICGFVPAYSLPQSPLSLPVHNISQRLTYTHVQSRINVLEHEVHRLTDISRRVTDELAQVVGLRLWW